MKAIGNDDARRRAEGFDFRLKRGFERDGVVNEEPPVFHARDCHDAFGVAVGHRPFDAPQVFAQLLERAVWEHRPRFETLGHGRADYEPRRGPLQRACSRDGRTNSWYIRPMRSRSMAVRWRSAVTDAGAAHG